MGVAERIGLSPWWLGPAALCCVAIGWLAGINPQYGLVAAIGITFTVVVLMDVTLGFVMFVTLTFLDLLNGSSSFSATKVIGLVLFVSWLARSSTRRTTDLGSFVAKNPALAAALIAMLGWAALSFAWAQSPAAALGGAGRFALDMMLIPIAFGAIRERQHVAWVLSAFVVGAVFSSVYGFVSPGSQTEGRFTGSFGDANAEATVLAAAIPILISLVGVFRNSARAKLVALVGVTIMFAGLVNTLSREGLVALGAVMVAAVVFGGRWRARAAKLLVIGVACTGGYYLVLAPLAARQRVTAADTSGRSSIWTVASRVIKAHPVLGVGTDNFILVEGRYVSQPGAIAAGYIITAPKAVHNAYLEALVDLGIPGLITMLAVLALALAAAVRAAWIFERLGDRQMELASRAVVLAVVAVLTQDFFVSGEYEKFQWLLLAMCPVLLALALREDASRKIEPAPAIT